MDSSTPSILLELLTFSVSKNQKLYVVGGTLRDYFSQKACTDFDLTGKNAANLGISFARSLNLTYVPLDNTPGRKTVRVILDQKQLDFTDLQGENIEEDLSQRDFTINAMGQLLSEFLSGRKNIIDPFNGQEDLKNKTLRVLQGPIFQSDPIRILRAFRFAATLGFEIEAETLKKIALHKNLLMEPAQERIWHELSTFFKSTGTMALLETMYHCGALECLLPISESKQVQIFTLYQKLETLLKEPEKTFPNYVEAFNSDDFVNNQYLFKLSLLLNRRHKNKTTDTPISQEWNLRASNAEVKVIDQTQKGAQYLAASYSKNGSDQNPADMYELIQIIQEGLLASVVVFASGNPSDDVIQFCNHLLKFYYQQFLPGINEKPFLNGDNLILQFKLSPSPLFRKILYQIQKAQVLGNITTQKEASKLAEDLIQSPSTELEL
jgi:poly(A) polymerase